MMNRKCRREHQQHWRTKELTHGKRLVICTLCNATEVEFKVRPENASK